MKLKFRSKAYLNKILQVRNQAAIIQYQKRTSTGKPRKNGEAKQNKNKEKRTSHYLYRRKSWFVLVCFSAANANLKLAFQYLVCDLRYFISLECLFSGWINMYEIWIRLQKGGNDQDLTLEIKALREDWDHITLSMFLYSVGLFSSIRNTILAFPFKKTRQSWGFVIWLIWSRKTALDVTAPPLLRRTLWG